MARYEYDDVNIRFRKVTKTVWERVKGVMAFLLVSMSLALLYYVLFSYVFSTDVEKDLKRENRIYTRLYPEMKERADLVGDVVEGLEVRDNQIYKEIFNSAAPPVDPLYEVAPIFVSDSLESRDFVLRLRSQGEALSRQAARVEEDFLEVFSFLASSKDPLPPMSLPLENFSYARTGAGFGLKISPYYKVEVQHNGIDLIASQGEAVYATAGGTVTDVVRSSKGLGNIVEIDHGNGFRTRYAHLSGITVYKGQKVARGRKIAEVGVSGNSFAPHLHYEVLREGEWLDPVNCFFASLGADQYARVLYMATITGQSLD